ncbi:hypothetical protein Tco_0186436 [Tanacetum coccineum]
MHMLAPKGSTYNGRPTFANPMYIKKAQSEKPCLYEIPYDKCDLENLFALDKEETLTLEQDSRSKLNKDLVKPYDYTKQNSLYEIFKPLSREYLDQLAHANEIRKKMWRNLLLNYVQSLEKDINELKSDKANFSNIYDLLLQECVSKDVRKALKKAEIVSKEVYNELLRSFAKIENYSISLELALQQYQEQMKSDIVCKQRTLP